MKRYYQIIDEGETKAGKATPKKTIEHLRPLTIHETKMQKLVKWLNKYYDVNSFTELKERGQDLITIRKRGLQHANLTT
jgi:hypothetical protein